MMSKTCKTPMCLENVWRQGMFTYSDYCWEHDPVVKEAKEKIERKVAPPLKEERTVQSEQI